MRATGSDMTYEYLVGVSGLAFRMQVYKKMASEVLTDAKNDVIAVAPYPWSLKSGETWTDEVLKGQIRRLEAALPIEREAIEQIEAAVALIKKAA